VFGFPDHGAVMTAQAKTFNISDIGITTNSGEPVARVTDQIATITQMTNPSTGAPWVIVFFNYQVTSRDYRTGNASGEALPCATRNEHARLEYAGLPVQSSFSSAESEKLRGCAVKGEGVLPSHQGGGNCSPPNWRAPALRLSM
jgi:hypothetical protein